MAETVDIQPEEAVAIALMHDLSQNHPRVVSSILAQHEVQPSTDPEQNFLLLARLSAQRGRFFNEDFNNVVAASAGYHGTELMPNVISQYINRLNDYQKVSAGYFKIGDLFKKKEGGTAAGNIIRNLFGKKDGKAADGTADVVAPGDTTEAGKQIMEKAGVPLPPDEDKKILGLKPWMFYSGLAFVIVLIIVIIIMIIRASKQKDEKK